MSVLHLTRTIPALVPRYVSRFSCVGPACEDTCCTGWRVAIDKKTFNAYRQTGHPELGPLFAATVKRQRSQGSDDNYARIELKEGSKECPLMEESLCAVHKKLNETYLSDTCFSYPRNSRNFGGQHEQALTLSCPEAARQALLAPDAFEFIEEMIIVRPDVVTNIKPKQGVPLELMNEVRIFCLQLMRSEGLELWQRLAVLGVFCESLTATLASGGHAAIPSLLESFVTMVEQDMVLDALGDIQPNHSIQARLFALLWQGKPQGGGSAHQNRVTAAVAKGLGAGAGGDVSGEKLVESYTNGVTRLPEALKAAPHLLDHYILNEMFTELFPFYGTLTPFEHYLRLLSRFGLVRMMLAAQCNTEGQLPDADALVQTVQVFCRRFQHDVVFATQVNQALKNSGWDKLDMMYAFLRT